MEPSYQPPDEPPEDHDPRGYSGAGIRTYVLIGVVLAILTGIEIQIPVWLADDRPLMIVWLLIGAFVKAGFVMLFYMHLKFDSKVYSGIVLLAILLIAYFLWLLTYGIAPPPLPS